MSVLTEAATLGVKIPDAVHVAVERAKQIRAMNPARIPLRDHVLDVYNAKDVDKALEKVANAIVADREREMLIGALRDEASRAIDNAIRSERVAIVDGFLTAPAVVEAARVIAEVAHTLPRDVPRSPSIERDGADYVVKVARVVAAWQTIEKVAATLTHASLLTGVEGANMTPALLLLDVEALDTDDALAWTNSLHLATSGHASEFGANIHVVDGSTLERLVPVVLAHTGPIALAPSADAYFDRAAKYHNARAEVIASREVQTHTESWVVNL